VAVVHVQGVNRVRRDGETQETNAMVTLVMTKEKGDWKIVAFQNTQIAPTSRVPPSGRVD
jgi:ketosteroid isomerase-like protein